MFADSFIDIWIEFDRRIFWIQYYLIDTIDLLSLISIETQIFYVILKCNKESMH